MVLPWVKKHERIPLEMSPPLNHIKRDIIRSLDRYSLLSVINCCDYLCSQEKFKAKWVAYLIIKWKFLATDTSKSVEHGKECTIKIFEDWCNAIWRSDCHMPSAFHFMRRLVDVQSSWQRQLTRESMFFPAFVNELAPTDPVRLNVTSTYGMEPNDIGVLVALLFSFRNHSNATIHIAKMHSENMHNQMVKIIEKLTINYKSICNINLEMKDGYKTALISYLAKIDIQQTSNESLEIPWIERYPIVNLESSTLFLVDEHLWQRRITTYLYECLTSDEKILQANIGLSFEGFCKQLISPFFTHYKVITELPKNRINADLVTEDDDHIYIFEIKHKKYDPGLFSKETKQELTSQLQNQIIHGYHQVKSTSENIDKKRNIFKSVKKNINKKRIGFVVTERSYKIGRGSNFSDFFDDCEKKSNHSIHDNNIYFIGIEELETLLLISQEKSMQVGKLVELGYGENGFELNFSRNGEDFQTTSKSLSQKMLNSTMESLNELKENYYSQHLNNK